MKTVKSSVFLIFILFALKSFGFIQSKVSDNTFLKFTPVGEEVVVDYDLSSLDVDEAKVDSYLLELSNKLSEDLGFEVIFFKGISGSAYQIKISDDSTIFTSSSIAAVTKLSFEDDGDILSAEIIINSDIELSEDEKSINYFGNVIAHEMGHMFGLDHSTSWGATMTPDLSPGQHTWESDDISGAIYSIGLDYKYDGVIRGVVVGGSDEKKIFGTNIDLIDIETMLIVQSQVSNRDGEFEFVNVDKKKKYIIGYGPFDFTSSYREEFLASFTSFCYGRSNYIYSPLTSCHNSFNDSPVIFEFNDDLIEIGSIGIKCDISSNKYLYDYTINTEQENDLLEHYDISLGPLYFNGVLADERSINIPFVIDSSSGNDVLRVSIGSQIFNSSLFLSGKVVNKSTSQEYILGENSFQSLNEFIFPAYEGVPYYNYIENVFLGPGRNEIVLELESISNSTVLQNIVDSSINHDDLYGGVVNEIGSFFLGLELGAIGNDGTFEPYSNVARNLSNDFFSCSMANNSFEIPPKAEASVSSSERVVSSGGCSVLAGDRSANVGFDYIYTLFEILFLIFLYGAFRRVLF